MLLFLWAPTITAAVAVRLGLISAGVAEGAAAPAPWAAQIAACSPAAVQATKRLATFGARLAAEERAEIERTRALVETKDDYKEGAAAFAGRR
jgi:enoyl-CoA hydratase/carnithine racemase